MLALAHRRVAKIPGAANRVRFTRADVRSDPLPAAGYDLIVTNFFLDCFRSAELATVIRRVSDVCAPDAVWVDGDFRLPSSGWARPVAKLLLAAMYGFFRLTTRLPTGRLTDPAPLLAVEGFRLVEEESQLRGFLSARLLARGSNSSFTLPRDSH